MPQLMERLLAKLERRWGHLVLPGISQYLVGAMALAFMLELARPGALDRMTLVPQLVLGGEWWRLFTYMLMPPATSIFWFIFAVMLYYTITTSLEEQWGTFKFQVFLVVGWLGTTVGAMLLGVPATNHYVLSSLFLAFATLFPDYQILLFFIIPIRVKWLALLDGLWMAYAFAMAPGLLKVIPVLAVANYLLFFAPHLLDLLRGQARRAERARAYSAFKREAEEVRPTTRRCAACGVSDADNPRAEFRVCICQEKCGGQPREFCMEHVNNH